jgi:hypothetical protein
MTEFGIVSFHGVSLRFVQHGLIESTVIIHIGIGGQAITVILRRVGRLIHHLLQNLKRTLQRQYPADNAMRGTSPCGDQVDFVSFEPTKV